MDNELQQKFQNYLKEINAEEIESIWERQSKAFRDFWKYKILIDNYPALTDIDEVVLFLDKNAKGSTRNSVAVAKAMIPQGVWRRLFKEIQSKKRLKELLYSILNESETPRT